MTGVTKILVPIRYPLTDESARTLAAAGCLAHDHAPANLRVLHVNLYQTGDDTQTPEFTHAISATLDDVKRMIASVREADAVLLGTPVCHGSYSSPLKTALNYCRFGRRR